MLKQPHALLARPRGRHPKGTRRGGQFRKAQIRFVRCERHAKWLESVGFVRQSEAHKVHRWGLTVAFFYGAGNRLVKVVGGLSDFIETQSWSTSHA